MSTGLLGSYWYFSRFDFNQLPASVPIVLDSGAFSAYTSGGSVDVHAYAKWAGGLADRIDWAISLDVLGDPGASLANWHLLMGAGVETVPVVHFGDRPEEVLPAYLTGRQPATRVALGGIAVSGTGRQVTAWTATVFRWMREHAPETALHGLGVHMCSSLSRFPWSSTDSSSHATAYMFGRATLWNPITKRWVKVVFDGKAPFRHGAMMRAYGVEPADVAVSNSTTRRAIQRLVVRSEMTAARHRDLLQVGAAPTSAEVEVCDRYLSTSETSDGSVLAEEITDACDRYLVVGAGMTGNTSAGEYAETIVEARS